MKYIKKVAVSPIPEINGSVVDTFNVEDKTTNAPSVNAVENYIKAQNTYSTEETFTGKYWIDGKKIYRKVVVYTHTEVIGESGKVTNILIPHNIQNWHTFVSSKAQHIDGFTLPIFGSSSGSAITSGTVCLGLIDNMSKIYFRIINDTWQPATWYFTLEYTKTTN